jgi:hypothetical protein
MATGGNRNDLSAVETEGSTPLTTKPATGQDPVPVPPTSHSNIFTALQFAVYTAAKQPFRNNEGCNTHRHAAFKVAGIHYHHSIGSSCRHLVAKLNRTSRR